MASQIRGLIFYWSLINFGIDEIKKKIGWNSTHYAENSKGPLSYKTYLQKNWSAQNELAF